MNICYIQARAGSKRYPGKNKAIWFGDSHTGDPMYKIAYDKACSAGVFDEVVISTDDPDILSDHTVYTVPRGESAASDSATDDDVAVDVLDRMRAEEGVACKLYPTVPLLHPSWLVQAFTMAEDYPGVRSIMEYEHPPQRAMYINAFGELQWVNPGYRNGYVAKRWHDAGAFVVFNIALFWKYGTVNLPGMTGIELPWHQHQDINYPVDYEKARLKEEYAQRLHQKDHGTGVQ